MHVQYISSLPGFRKQQLPVFFSGSAIDLCWPSNVNVNVFFLEGGGGTIKKLKISVVFYCYIKGEALSFLSYVRNNFAQLRHTPT